MISSACGVATVSGRGLGCGRGVARSWWVGVGPRASRPSSLASDAATNRVDISATRCDTRTLAAAARSAARLDPLFGYGPADLGGCGAAHAGHFGSHRDARASSVVGSGAVGGNRAGIAAPRSVVSLTQNRSAAASPLRRSHTKRASPLATCRTTRRNLGRRVDGAAAGRREITLDRASPVSRWSHGMVREAVCMSSFECIRRACSGVAWERSPLTRVSQQEKSTGVPRICASRPRR